jgi:Kef-type K+ transport system membrane component KefB
MPLFFILFFVLAGSNLHLEALPSLGIIGIVYVISRSAGLIIGSRLGAVVGGADEKIKKYLGIGVISQAGVAIGLALVVRREFAGLGRVISPETGITTGDRLGFMTITIITATSVIFEIIGPILAKIALSRAGEINAAVAGHKE